MAELTLFGGFELRLAGGEMVDLPGQKDRALLALLALRPGATQSRDKLAGLLWSERGDAQARDSLKHALTRLRQCFAAGPPPIAADRRSVTLDPAALATDVGRFERLLGEGTDDALEQAAMLYRGDLLDGIGVHDPSFEEWLSGERQRLRQAVEDALTRLMERSLAAGASERAAVAARRLLTFDPLREVACRTLMQIDAERSQTAQALRLFETLRDRLHRELGVKPEPATQQLYESIRRRAAAPVADPGPAEAPAAAEPPLPSRPSIAVLPFVNLSGDPEQEYFADGMVEEIITALSRLRWLMVIARNSSFIYRGRAVDVKQIGRELGVRYVLEGSVRKAGSRVRIAGQLIDAASGAHLWADRFEGGLEDVFDLQDQVTTSVISAIAPKLEQAEIERARRKPPASLDAYDYFLRGMAGVHQWTRQAVEEALPLFYRAIELDPGFAAAYGMAARCYSQRKTSGWMTDPAREIAEAERLARRAGELGKDDAVALSGAGIALAYVVGDLESGAAFTDRAIELNPNLAWGWLFSGVVRVWLGEPEVALERIHRAMRLSPHDSHFGNMRGCAAWAHFMAGRYDEALSGAEAAVREQPSLMFAFCVAAASGALGGRLDAARKAMAQVRRLDPTLRMSNLRAFFPTRRAEDFARWEEGLRLAGLPD